VTSGRVRRRNIYKFKKHGKRDGIKGLIHNNSLNFYTPIGESLNLLSKKWKIAPEIYDLHLGKRNDVIDIVVQVDRIKFHIPKLTTDGLFVLWKCLWPDCHNCCERQDRIPLTDDDFDILAKKLGYKSKVDFIKNETLISNWKHRESFGFVNTTRTQISLKRKKDESEDEDGTLIPCRFLDSSGCGIHPDKPGVCWMYPFSSYLELESNGRLIIHASFQLTGDCPGFYLANSLESIMPTLNEYSKKIWDYNMAFARTRREKYCVTSSLDLGRT
jgi:uncharacterized protein